MRAAAVIAALAAGIAACSDTAPRRNSANDGHTTPLTAGEERARIVHRAGSSTTMRSGPNVPIHLPPGFTVYPNATVVINTLVERDGERRILLVFETGDPVASVLGFYRDQARVAGAAIAFDLGGEDRASLGGTLSHGGDFAISIRASRLGARVEFAAS